MVTPGGVASCHVKGTASVNIGYAVTVGIVGGGMLLSARPVRRPHAAGVVTWVLSAVANESPSLALGYLLLCSIPLLTGAPGDGSLAWLALGCASFAVTPILLRRSLAARPTLREALEAQLRPVAPEGWRSRVPWWRIVVAPLPVFARGVRVARGRRYGPGRRHRVDVYTSRRAAPNAGRPVLVHLHGGAFRSGRKSVYARPLLHAFAQHGWICLSPSYRLRPARYADMLADVHAVLTWARAHAQTLGGDPSRVVLVGSSAGAHLALTAALTADAETPVAAVVGLYGYYGRAEAAGCSAPIAHVHAQAPPVMIVHGAQDTLVPPGLQTSLVAALRSTSSNPVVHAELPGAQHTFDLVHSIRFEYVIDAIAVFASSVFAHDRTAGPAPRALRAAPERNDPA